MKSILIFLLAAFSVSQSFAQKNYLKPYNITWTSESKNSGESMPCGGGDIGLNVWVEKGDLLFYIARSGTYDENNALLKAGRVRVRLSPNPFASGDFKQTLNLYDGNVLIEAQGTKINLWVDVFNPQVHVEITSAKPLTAEAGYETWRYKDLLKAGRENNENAYKSAATSPVKSYKDSVAFQQNAVLFFHQNKHQESVFDLTVKQQGLEKVKSQLDDPLKNRVFGGLLSGRNFQSNGLDSGRYLNTSFKAWKLKSIRPSTSQNFTLTLFTEQTPSLTSWKNGLQKQEQKAGSDKRALQNTQNWWHQFWERSFILIDQEKVEVSSAAWQSGRNYQLFRYMLACNVSGSYPTKFNGGLFTYDPVLTDTGYKYTPDFRNWGGSIFTAQNQRLVYFPMLKSGDFDVLKPQLDFYLRLLKNAETATQTYWPHRGARFTEQLENFGLSDLAEYGNNRPKDLDAGVDYNPWLEYHWETVLEFCLMMLETEDYGGKDIHAYIPFIESCLRFFDEHYQYLALQRGSKALDGDGRLVLYPGSAAETFKMAYNSTSTISGLKVVLQKILRLPTGYLDESQRTYFNSMLKRIPEISFQYMNGYKTIAPARSWERINNEESPQLYPVYPWGIFGIEKPNLDLALNTWNHDSTVIKFRNYIGWKQDNIFAARLGLTKEAADLTFAKLKDSGRRFPAFWGPGFDWTPDHNWGGSGMIGLQEMLLQAADGKIYLFPAWPKNIDVHFKLHTSKQTTVECVLKNGKFESLKVMPESRSKDVINCLADKL
ncbi:hypothetical protein GS399_19710 [Pedobacter sp. HMF7647]|uniref:DUF5703 domain-containing protein n=1 Tax=Hufsiella arboris TaxID=2695275 RepID=A0A7K1YGM6_9SPHI|nr:DUF5703 domain-containing protein [Hufsiella arboris]MXV53199.1 hypothetical protein [Hufsiella arboris]